MVTRVVPPRRGEALTATGVGTTRFMEYLEILALNSTDALLAIDNQYVQNLNAAILDLQSRIGSGDALTSDCDSLTVDSDVLYVDMTEA